MYAAARYLFLVTVANAQVDWGEYGTIQVGNTRRRLSFFLMVLCFSRRMYLEFTVMQTMEHFLAAHENAFRAFGGVPARIIIANLLAARARALPKASPLQLTRRQDLLDIELAQPDLSLYEVRNHENQVPQN